VAIRFGLIFHVMPVASINRNVSQRPRDPTQSAQVGLDRRRQPITLLAPEPRKNIIYNEYIFDAMTGKKRAQVS